MAKTPIEAILDGLEYTETGNQPNEDGLPYVTHSGKMDLGGFVFNVHVLNNGMRIIPEEDLISFFEGLSNG